MHSQNNPFLSHPLVSISKIKFVGFAVLAILSLIGVGEYLGYSAGQSTSLFNQSRASGPNPNLVSATFTDLNKGINGFKPRHTYGYIVVGVKPDGTKSGGSNHINIPADSTNPHDIVQVKWDNNGNAFSSYILLRNIDDGQFNVIKEGITDIQYTDIGDANTKAVFSYLSKVKVEWVDNIDGDFKFAPNTTYNYYITVISTDNVRTVSPSIIISDTIPHKGINIYFDKADLTPGAASIEYRTNGRLNAPLLTSGSINSPEIQSYLDHGKDLPIFKDYPQLSNANFDQINAGNSGKPGFKRSHSYSYFITGIDTKGKESRASNHITVLPDTKDTNTIYAYEHIVLKWESNGNNFTKYNIWRTIDNGSFKIVGSTNLLGYIDNGDSTTAPAVVNPPSFNLSINDNIKNDYYFAPNTTYTYIIESHSVDTGVISQQKSITTDSNPHKGIDITWDKSQIQNGTVDIQISRVSPNPTGIDTILTSSGKSTDTDNGRNLSVYKKGNAPKDSSDGNIPASDQSNGGNNSTSGNDNSTNQTAHLNSETIPTPTAIKDSNGKEYIPYNIALIILDQDNKAITNAIVTFNAQKIQSDSKGYAVFYGLKENTYSAQVTYNGISASKTVNIQGSNHVIKQIITLTIQNVGQAQSQSFIGLLVNNIVSFFKF